MNENGPSPKRPRPRSKTARINQKRPIAYPKTAPTDV